MGKLLQEAIARSDGHLGFEVAAAILGESLDMVEPDLKLSQSLLWDKFCERARIVAAAPPDPTEDARPKTLMLRPAVEAFQGDHIGRLLVEAMRMAISALILMELNPNYQEAEDQRLTEDDRTPLLNIGVHALRMAEIATGGDETVKGRIWTNWPDNGQQDRMNAKRVKAGLPPISLATRERL